jgi:hypothetical protein
MEPITPMNLIEGLACQVLDICRTNKVNPHPHAYEMLVILGSDIEKEAGKLKAKADADEQYILDMEADACVARINELDRELRRYNGIEVLRDGLAS